MNVIAHETMDRKRRQNCDRSELELLSIEVEKSKDILFAKLNNKVTKQKKGRVWSAIAERVGAANEFGATRTADEVRKKWSNVASETKKRASAYKREARKTGGGPAATPTESPFDDRVAGILGQTAIFGVDGGFDTSQPTANMSEDDVHVPAVWDLSCKHTATAATMATPIDLPTSIVSTDVSFFTVDTAPTFSRMTPRCSINNECGSSKPKMRRKITETMEQNRLVDIEQARLDVEKQRLGVETERLAVEKSRLALEERRFKLEEDRHSLYVHKLAGIVPTITYADETIQ